MAPVVATVNVTGYYASPSKSGHTFMAPVVAMVNVTEHYVPNDGRHEWGPYDY